MAKRDQFADLFSDAPPLSKEDAALVAAYQKSQRTLDDLPYTEEFEQLYAEVGGEGSGRSRREVFRRLHNLRKAAMLPRLGRAATPPIKVSEGEEGILESIVIERLGTLGQRDQLPYHDEFDHILGDFNTKTRRELTPHDLWRLLAKIAK